MTGYRHRFPRYGTAGLVVLLLMETALFCGQSPKLNGFPWWHITGLATPVCWWAYILTIDAWIYCRTGTSLLTARRRTFFLQCILSVTFWCLFEAYNRVMPGWRYQNLDTNLSLRMFGYAVSFATIMPGLFLTCELLQSYSVFGAARMPSISWSRRALRASATIGAVLCFAPPLFPANVRGYLWAFVWMGWFFLLEPFNYWRGAQSIYGDWEEGNLARTLQLFSSGLICGVLWEFWNMWAFTKWIYIFPLGQNLKLFEMPLIGYLGFLPFALEFFVMFNFLASFFTREDRLEL